MPLRKNHPPSLAPDSRFLPISKEERNGHPSCASSRRRTTLDRKLKRNTQTQCLLAIGSSMSTDQFDAKEYVAMGHITDAKGYLAAARLIGDAWQEDLAILSPIYFLLCHAI